MTKSKPVQFRQLYGIWWPVRKCWLKFSSVGWLPCYKNRLLHRTPFVYVDRKTAVDMAGDKYLQDKFPGCHAAPIVKRSKS